MAENKLEEWKRAWDAVTSKEKIDALGTECFQKQILAETCTDMKSRMAADRALPGLQKRLDEAKAACSEAAKLLAGPLTVEAAISESENIYKCCESVLNGSNVAIPKPTVSLALLAAESVTPAFEREARRLRDSLRSRIYQVRSEHHAAEVAISDLKRKILHTTTEATEAKLAELKQARAQAFADGCDTEEISKQITETKASLETTREYLALLNEQLYELQYREEKLRNQISRAATGLDSVNALQAALAMFLAVPRLNKTLSDVAASLAEFRKNQMAVGDFYACPSASIPLEKLRLPRIMSHVQQSDGAGGFIRRPEADGCVTLESVEGVA